MKIAAVVILYRPGADVMENIASYGRYVHKMYVYDNTEFPLDLEKTPGLLSNMEYYHDGLNEGIAKRLNQALTRVWNDNYDWLLTMDQDTNFADHVFKQYLACIQHFAYGNDVAMFGMQYSKRLLPTHAECGFEEVENMITSGTVLNARLARQIGLFDENLYIDSVDHDYVIRTRHLGFRIIRFTNLQMVHHLGSEVNRASIKTLFLVKKRKIVHSPQRCYYMFRNMLYLHTKHKDKDVKLMAQLKKLVTGNLLTNIFYGRNAVTTFKYLAKARIDFAKGRMGKIE